MVQRYEPRVTPVQDEVGSPEENKGMDAYNAHQFEATMVRKRDGGYVSLAAYNQQLAKVKRLERRLEIYGAIADIVTNISRLSYTGVKPSNKHLLEILKSVDRRDRKSGRRFSDRVRALEDNPEKLKLESRKSHARISVEINKISKIEDRDERAEAMKNFMKETTPEYEEPGDESK